MAFSTVFIALFSFLITSLSFAEVEGACTMCHKYPGLGIKQKEENKKGETKRIYYINNDLFAESYHGRVRCLGCHIGVEKIPHTGAPKVDCSTNCHILDPSTNKEFSHKKIVSDFNKSAHGPEGAKHPDKKDLPICKDCHTNKTYHASVEEKDRLMVFLKVCNQCHESEEFTKHFYEHIIYRTAKRRGSKEVIRLCSTCHADQDLMKKHELDAVSGFSSTFHAKAISYGNEHVANCLNCHAPYQLGFSPHKITSGHDPISPVSDDNKLKTCSQVDCHSGANKYFVSTGRVHPSLNQSTSLAIGESQRLIQEASQGLNKESIRIDSGLEAMIIYGIRLFYKTLMIAIPGFFVLHRLLDLNADRREKKLRGETHE